MSCLKCVVCKRKTNESTTLFRFPVDLDKRLAWAKFLGLNVEQLKPLDRLCSWHFETAAFKFTVQRGKKFVLKASAVPTIKHVEALATTKDRSAGKYKTCESGFDGFYYYCAVCGLVDRKCTRFSFPTAKKELDIWLDFCRINIVDFKPKSHRLCISHFKKDDMIQQPAARNTLRFRLKPGTIPTLNKPESLMEADDDDASINQSLSEDLDTESTKFAENVLKYADDLDAPIVESTDCARTSGARTSGAAKAEVSGTSTTASHSPKSHSPKQSSLPVHLDEINEGHCCSSKLALSILRIAKRERADHLKQLNALGQRLRMLEKELERKSRTVEEDVESASDDEVSLNQDDPGLLAGSDIETDSGSNASILEFEISCADVTSTESVELEMPIEDALEEPNQDPLTSELPQAEVTADGNENNQPFDEVLVDIPAIKVAPVSKPTRTTCPHCKKTLNKKFLKRHIELVHMLTEDTIKKCPYCSKSFPELSLRRHIRQVHQNQEYLCDICSTTFKSESSLRRHALGHSDKRVRNYTCEVCGLKFLTLSNLTGHQTTHDKERKPEFACDQCDRTFYYKGGLTTHKKIHSSSAAECSVCKKRFARQIDLVIHMRSHSGEMPFKCNLCPKAFRNKTPYKHHLLKHQGHVFKCDICGTEFRSFHSLGMHRKKHTGLPMKCKICKKEFLTNYKARLHVQNVHKISKDAEKHLLRIKQKEYVPRKSRLVDVIDLVDSS